jgi:translation initiation factor IF-3
VNDRIRAPKVRVILASGEQLGVMSSREALAKAQMLGLDLVEIAAQSDPPVCKIIDYGKFKYEQSKLKKQKSKSSNKMKEIKFRPSTGQHDYNIKLSRAEGFLDTNHKVRCIVQFKGRENAHRDLGFELLRRIIDDLKTMGQVDQQPHLSGRALAMIMAPLAQHLRKRKFQLYHGDLIEDEDEDDEAEGVLDDTVPDEVPDAVADGLGEELPADDREQAVGVG